MGAAETLLFLPGASGNVDFWKPVSERLAHRGARRFIGYPGLGGVPAEVAVTCFDDLVSRTTLEMTGPVGVIAQSMGGVIAVLAALQKPESVRHLVLTVTSGSVELRRCRVASGARGRTAERAAPDHE